MRVSHKNRIQGPKHFLSVDDFTIDEYKKLFLDTATIKAEWQNSTHEIFIPCENKRTLVSLLFTQPSTRTSGSFEKAAQALGCNVTTLHVSSSSIAKGESYRDTAMMAGLAANVLVVRHKGKEGTLQRLADKIFPRHDALRNVAIVNAGEGTGEHPTQALLDMYTIHEKFGNIKGLRIGVYGDLKYGRTTHSLLRLGSRFGAQFVCISPEDLSMPKRHLQYAANFGPKPTCTKNIHDVINELDVLYVTRLQREYRPDKLHHEPKEKISGYGVTPKLLKLFPKHSVVMHPLPRLDELPTECDKDPRVIIVSQAYNGIMARTALLRYILQCAKGASFRP